MLKAVVLLAGVELAKGRGMLRFNYISHPIMTQLKTEMGSVCAREVNRLYITHSERDVPKPSGCVERPLDVYPHLSVMNRTQIQFVLL